jgi:hydrogenase maturation factor
MAPSATPSGRRSDVMCISYPGQVVGVDASGAVVAAAGRHRRASTLLYPDVAVGDWVSVAAGTIVDRLTVSEAAELQQLLDRGRDPDPEPAAPWAVPTVHRPNIHRSSTGRRTS